MELLLTYMDWLAQTEEQVGSWWPVWYKWLDEHRGEKRAPPTKGAVRKGYEPLRDAPGEYVLG
jgi:polyhydroxyalkanoate synthase